MKLLIIFILIFGIQSWSKADDIREFEIEGISIENSLIDFYKISKIKKALKEKVSFPKSDKFYRIVFKSNSEKYNFLAYYLKKGDKNYEIFSLEGLNYMDFSKCKIKTRSIEDSLKNLLGSNYKIFRREVPHAMDKTNNSIIYEIHFIDLKDETNWSASISCTNWSKKYEKKGYFDSLAVYLNSKEFSHFMHYEAY